MCVWSVISFDSLIKISCLRWLSCKLESWWIIKNILTYTLIDVSCIRSICDDIFCLFIENTNISVMLSWWEFFSYNLLHIDWTLLTFTFFNLSNFVFSNLLFLFKIQHWVVSLFILIQIKGFFLIYSKLDSPFWHIASRISFTQIIFVTILLICWRRICVLFSKNSFSLR